ncbi:MAG TPA: hydroxyacid dehydrogenase [Candidatus Paceibacterota bacterium]|jgi:D-3-phosphoglycerate dehydrogenase|nr:hydroxyacid dehydrogenase [Candidatus Paceibacterota bacterium]
MEKTNILVTDPVHPEALERLTLAGFTITELPEAERGRLAEFVEPYHALICRTSTTVDRAVFERAAHLKCVAIASTGYDRIDVDEATRRGIAVLGLPPHNKDIDPEHDGNFVSTAEHAVLLMLAALDDLYSAAHSLKDNRWEKSYLVGTELADKTVGFFGFGRIAGLVAKRLAGFRVKLIAHDPYADKEKARNHGVQLVSFDELCAQADIITIHAPRTKETEKSFNADAFSKMKDGIFLINTARSAIIEEEALIEALKSGKVKRAALDVFHDEPLGINRDLIALPNVIATPHIGGSTHEAWRRISLNAADNIIAYFAGETRNRINI